MVILLELCSKMFTVKQKGVVNSNYMWDLWLMFQNKKNHYKALINGSLAPIPHLKASLCSGKLNINFYHIKLFKTAIILGNYF